MPDSPSSPERVTLSTERRLHYALALLSYMEWHDWMTHTDCCPVCGWPVEGHHGSRHEPGCSLEAVLRGEVPTRLVRLEERHGDAAFGYDGRDRRKHATPVAPVPESNPDPLERLRSESAVDAIVEAMPWFVGQKKHQRVRATEIRDSLLALMEGGERG